MYDLRHIAIIFKPESTVKELKKLKLRLSDQWLESNMKWLIKLYKNCKKDS